jgi:hypothetical protein
MDWLRDLMTTCMHHSELQVITKQLTPSLLSLLLLVVAWYQLSAVAVPLQYVHEMFSGGGSSASMVTSLFAG